MPARVNLQASDRIPLYAIKVSHDTGVYGELIIYPNPSKAVEQRVAVDRDIRIAAEKADCAVHSRGAHADVSTDRAGADGAEHNTLRSSADELVVGDVQAGGRNHQDRAVDVAAEFVAVDGGITETEIGLDGVA